MHYRNDKHSVLISECCPRLCTDTDWNILAVYIIDLAILLLNNRTCIADSPKVVSYILNSTSKINIYFPQLHIALIQQEFLRNMPLILNPRLGDGTIQKCHLLYRKCV